MALYFLSYDLRKAKNYQALYDELGKFGALRMLKSEWCFKRVNTTAVGLRDHFKQFVDSDDGLLVTEVSDWAGYGLEKNPNQLS